MATDPLAARQVSLISTDKKLVGNERCGLHFTIPGGWEWALIFIACPQIASPPIDPKVIKHLDTMKKRTL